MRKREKKHGLERARNVRKQQVLELVVGLFYALLVDGHEAEARAQVFLGLGVADLEEQAALAALGVTLLDDL